jgi:dUTP pyrophosphatase
MTLGSIDLTPNLPGALSREQLMSLILGDPPLLTEYISLSDQVQPNGVDVTLHAISRYSGRGTVAASNADRVLPDLEPLQFDEAGYIDLDPGPYHIVYNEVVNLPLDLMALGRPRSSLGRCGVTIHTAVWDAGYHGRSTSLLVVNNPAGFRLQRDAKVMQLVFFGLSRRADQGYSGRYQGENLAASVSR